MSESTWLALFGFLFPTVTALTTAVIGYLALRFKASKANVESLEQHVAKLENRVKVVEQLEQACQDERLRLYKENLQLREDKLRLEAKVKV